MRPSRNPEIPALESLVQAEDFVLKEHFDGYRPEGIHLSSKLPAMVFNLCADRTPVMRNEWDQTKEKLVRKTFETLYPGLVVRNRSELGVPAYHLLHPHTPTTYRGAYLAELGIEAGSLINLLPMLDSRPAKGRQERFLASFVLKLSHQVNP